MRIFLTVIILLMVLVEGCANTELERSENFMGTVLTLKVEGVNSQKVITESFSKVAELQKNILSDTKKIEDAAGNGEFVQIDSEVFEILKISQIYSRLTDGAFDVTIGAALNLWKTARQNSRLPTDEEILNIKRLVNYKNLELRESDYSARLKVAGMKITLGGVAKGYAVDAIRKIFDTHRINNGLINFGTSTIYAVGEKNIGLKNPRADSVTEILKIRDSAISTSGNYENFSIVEGRRIHHIINPKTCRPVENKIMSVSVIVEGKLKNCATVADIFSTAFFIMDSERTEKFLSENGLAEIVNVTILVDD